MKILLVCSGGMSTSLLAEAIKKSAEAEGEPCHVESGSVSAVGEMAPKFDLVLVGPQVRHLMRGIEEQVKPSGRPVALIPPQLYGTIDGGGIIKVARELLGKQRA